MLGNLLDLKYIFETGNQSHDELYQLNNLEISNSIDKLPENLVLQMYQAAMIADIDLIIELIHQIDQEQAGLGRHLLQLANNFDYEYLKQILNRKEN